MTDETIPYVGTVNTDSDHTDELATLTWDKHLLPFGKHGGQGSTDPSVIMMSFGEDWFESGHTEIQQPSLLECGKRSWLVPKAARLIRTNGGPLLVSFLTSAWHLRIASKSVAMPAFSDIEPSGFGGSETCIVLQAKLSVLRPKSQGLGVQSNATSAWRAVARKEVDAEILSFLFTVLQEAERLTNR